jgi:3-oxoadipate enol-lactonase
VPDMADRLGEIEQPALVVAGELDRPDILAIAGRLERELANATAVRVPGAGHLPSLERPDAFEAAVAPFLARAAT